MVTLHAYVLREMLKTFGLALTALVVVFTMGGGIYNVIRVEGLSASDLFRFLPLLLPVIVTLTMPLAALFAATMVYGRLAADNELRACSAAGINVHRLFVSAFLLSLFVAAFSLLFGNFVIPNFMLQMDRYARANLCDIAAARLRHRGYVRWRDEFFLTAEQVQTRFDRAELARKGYDPALDYLSVTSPTLLQLDANGKIVRFTTADLGMCEFDTRSTPIRVTLYVNEAQDYEVGKRVARLSSQPIGPIEWPLVIPRKESWADLNTLIDWQRAPWKTDRIAPELHAFLTRLAVQRFAADAAAALDAGRNLEFTSDDGSRLVLRATRASVPPERRSRVQFEQAELSILRSGQTAPLRYTAGSGEIGLPGNSQEEGLPARGVRADVPAIVLRLFDVGQRTADDAQAAIAGSADSRTFEGLQLPDEALALLRTPDPMAVLRQSDEAHLTPRQVEEKSALLAKIDQSGRKLRSLIHFRLAMALSALVTIIMGATLGAIFRGARVLLAFFLAFIPFALVGVLIVMGRQLGDSEHTAFIGPFVIWGGLAATGLLGLGLLRVGVRR